MCLRYGDRMAGKEEREGCGKGEGRKGEVRQGEARERGVETKERGVG